MYYKIIIRMANETNILKLATDVAKEKSEKLNKSYKELKDAFNTGKVVEVNVIEKVTSGGFKVSYNEVVSLYLPVSLYTSKRDITEEELLAVVGNKIPVKVKEYSEEEFGRIIKINHKEVIEDKLWSEVVVNTKTEAKVKKILPQGAIVVLPNGLEGFIPVSHIAREHIEDINSYVSEGEVIKGDIIEANKEYKKIIVSLRNAPSKHLIAFFDAHNIGDRVKGKLKNIMPSRAYFTIAPNIDGSVKASEVTWTRKHIRLNDFFDADKEYDFEIINLDRDNQYIGLSYRKTQPDNWQEIADKYTEGYTYSAVVEFIPPNSRGAEVSVNNEIDGFMPKHLSPALYNDNKPTFKAKDVIQVKLVEKNEKTRSFIFESAIKQFSKYDSAETSTSVAAGKNLSTPDVIKNFSLADLLSESSKKALK